MKSFHSNRFGMDVVLTRHAVESMEKRNVNLEILQEVLELGEIKHRAGSDMWVFKHIAGRADNLICAAVVVENVMVVKTVMINWELEDES